MQDILEPPSIASKLAELFRYMGDHDIPLYVLIDEYDNMGIMREWYDGYRFAKDSVTHLYNTDMVLYYLKHSMPNRGVPEYLIDTNVRIDYGKLRHLLVVGRQLNGNFDLLREVIGEEHADARIQPGFPLGRLAERENFLSLLHYFGLLSIRDGQGMLPRLAIPHQTVKRLMYGYLRDGYRDVGVFPVDLYRFEQLARPPATPPGTCSWGVRHVNSGKLDTAAEIRPDSSSTIRCGASTVRQASTQIWM